MLNSQHYKIKKMYTIKKMLRDICKCINKAYKIILIFIENYRMHVTKYMKRNNHIVENNY